MTCPITFRYMLTRLSKFFRFGFCLICLSLIFRCTTSTALNHSNCPDSSITIHIVQMIIGDGETNLGYNVISPAYDVALGKASQLHPRVFANQTMTRYFVPGHYSCAESTGMATVGLYTLLAPKGGFGCRNEFRIVLSPGCTFEIIALGDFARESKVPVLASSASVPTPERFPTLLALSPTSYSILVRAVAEVLKQFDWETFNLLCDKNRDPIQVQAVEVICAMILSHVQTRARELSIVLNYFDSSKPETYETVLMESKKHSTVNVLASYTSTYELLLAQASSSEMATGEYVFILLALTPFLQMEESTWNTIPSRLQEPLTKIFPFVFLLGFDEVNWDAVANETEAMGVLSKNLYNWTVVPERQHNLLRLSAYESVLTMAQVLDENYENLRNMSAEEFALKFTSRRFDLPSRTVKTSETTSRTLFVFDYMRGLLSHNDSVIRWPSEVKFPPDFLPPCRFSSGERCNGNTNGRRHTTVVATVSSSAAIILFAVLLIFIKRRLYIVDVTWWIVPGMDIILPESPYQSQVRMRYFDKEWQNQPVYIPNI